MIESVCAVKIESNKIIEILQNLNCNVKYDSQNNNYLITPPKNRLDLKVKEDIIEEIIRIYGFDKIVPTIPKINRVGK
ncbi:MAG: hypothetical protein QM532_03540, partial [Cyanobium sp. MAG06]|nr:hypothetical protein [Cyanobium sp. MAG06]